MRGSSKRLLLASLLGLALLATACPQQQEPEAERSPTVELQDGGSIVFAAEQEPSGFNINTSKDNLFALSHVIQQIWPSAYVTQPDFTVKPDLLESKAKLVSESPFLVEWKIKKEAVWDDGTPVSADDFEYYWQNCKGTDENADCASTSGYDIIEKLEKVDQKTVRTTFSKPYVDYEGLFGTLPPSHLAKTRPGGWNTGFDADPGASAGPYKLKEWVKGDHITLERNDKFWGKKARLDTITFRQIPDAATHPQALQNGEVQLIYPQPQVDLVQNVKGIQGTKSEIGFGPTWEHLTYNLKNEHLADVNVRKAIAKGVDRDAIVTALVKPFSDKAARLDNRVYVQGQKEYEAHGKEYQKRDVKAAQALLEKAGYTKNASTGIYEKGGKALSVRLRVRTPNPRREEAQKLMQAQLKEVGVDIKVDNFTTSLGQTLAKGDFDLIIFAWVGTPFPASGAEQLYKSTSDSNFGSYKSDKVDELTGKAVAETNAGDREKILQQVDEQLWEDMIDLPLFQLPTFIAYQDKYVNIIDNTTNQGPFWNALEWGIKKEAA